MEKLISSNGNLYKVVMLPTGGIRFYVRAGYNFREIRTAPAIARITAAMVGADHAEALEMNTRLDAAFARIDELAPDEDAKAIFKAIASKYEVGCVMGVGAAHAEALMINTQIDEALKALAVTIARTPEGNNTSRHCENTLEYINEKFGVWIPYLMLADLVVRVSQ